MGVRYFQTHNPLPPGGLSVDGGTEQDSLTLANLPIATAIAFDGTQLTCDGLPIHLNSIENVAISSAQAGTIALSGAARLNLASQPGHVFQASGLTLDGQAVLDLADNDLILSYAGLTPLPAVRQWLANGRSGATPMIITSQAGMALGLVNNALLHLPTIAGQALAGFSQVLVKRTVPGDTNLDGQVTQADYVNIIANMGSTNSQWFLGDLNHDGMVTLDDLAVLLANLVAGNGADILAPQLTGRPKLAVAAARTVKASRVVPRPPVVHKKPARQNLRPKVAPR